jgi:hypothetical protein
MIESDIAAEVNEHANEIPLLHEILNFSSELSLEECEWKCVRMQIFQINIS